MKRKEKKKNGEIEKKRKKRKEKKSKKRKQTKEVFRSLIQARRGKSAGVFSRNFLPPILSIYQRMRECRVLKLSMTVFPIIFFLYFVSLLLFFPLE